MIEEVHGIMIHAKIIDIQTKKVIASTSKFLPDYVGKPLKALQVIDK